MEEKDLTIPVVFSLQIKHIRYAYTLPIPERHSWAFYAQQTLSWFYPGSFESTRFFNLEDFMESINGKQLIFGPATNWMMRPADTIDMMYYHEEIEPPRLVNEKGVINPNSEFVNSHCFCCGCKFHEFEAYCRLCALTKAIVSYAIGFGTLSYENLVNETLFNPSHEDTTATY